MAAFDILAATIFTRTSSPESHLSPLPTSSYPRSIATCYKKPAASGFGTSRPQMPVPRPRFPAIAAGLLDPSLALPGRKDPRNSRSARKCSTSWQANHDARKSRISASSLRGSKKSVVSCLNRVGCQRSQNDRPERNLRGP
jgi:hypothetical protein